jgi:hypothetical protein
MGNEEWEWRDDSGHHRVFESNGAKAVVYYNQDECSWEYLMWLADDTYVTGNDYATAEEAEKDVESIASR